MVERHLDKSLLTLTYLAEKVLDDRLCLVDFDLWTFGQKIFGNHKIGLETFGQYLAEKRSGHRHLGEGDLANRDLAIIHLAIRHLATR